MKYITFGIEVANLKVLGKYRLLIIDEIGYLPITSGKKTNERSERALKATVYNMRETAERMNWLSRVL